MRRLAIVLLLNSGASTLVFAQDEPEDLADRIAACSAIVESQARLQCFDSVGNDASPPQPAETNTSDAVTTEQPEELPPAAPVVAVEQASTAEPGEEQVKTSSDKETDEDDMFAVTLIQTNLDAYGRWIFVFDNGQIWRQTEKGKHVSAPHEMPVAATIRKGFLGSYTIHIDETGQRIAIKQIE